MSQKIPFLEMFAALRQWTELSNGVEGWLIVSAAIDKGSRSAKILVERAEGAGPNLIAQAEEAVCRAYGLGSVKIEAAAPADNSVSQTGAQRSGSGLEKRSGEVSELSPTAGSEGCEPRGDEDPFARTEAIRQAALKRAGVKPSGPSAPKGEKKSTGKAIFGKTITKAPTPMGDLELDMGTVVVEGDVFAVDNRELKKRGAWVVAFDMTDYTGSIRVNKFFPGDEGKPLVDGIKKGMHVKVQGRLNMDRFYGDMVLEPVAVTAVEKKMKEDTAPEKRVELHLHTTMSSMDALTSVGPKLGPDKNVVKRAEAWGHPAIAITDHGVAHSFPDAWHSGQKDQAALWRRGLFCQRRGRPGGHPWTSGPGI